MAQIKSQAAQELTPISRANRNSLGFTLLEILIVIGIIVAVVAIGVPKLANKKGQMRQDIQRISVLSRELFNEARLKNRTYRLAFDLSPNVSKFYVESAAGQVQMLTEDQEKALSEKTEADREEEAKLNAPKFELETKYTKKPEELTQPLHVESIEYAGRKNATEAPSSTDDGATKAVINYLPQGLTEQALIHFTDGKTLNWTIVIHPLTGRADILDGKVTLKDIGL